MLSFASNFQGQTDLRSAGFKALQRAPFVIYADFECLNEKLDVPLRQHGRTHAYQRHMPCSAGYLVVSDAPDLQFPFESYTGPDSVDWFLRRMADITESCVRRLHDIRQLIRSEESEQDFFNATQCCFCGGDLWHDRVRDHDHITGAYRGAAHRRCNLLVQQQRKIFVFIHNFRNYDAHLITKALARWPQLNISVIGQTMEKYLTLTLDHAIEFKDSCQFMKCSLEQLAQNLLQDGRDGFRHTLQGFAGATDEQVELILRKGVYPYDWVDAFTRFDEANLPPIEAFESRLKHSTLTQNEYDHAQRVWRAFHCAQFLDYHNLYLKTDVLLLGMLT